MSDFFEKIELHKKQELPFVMYRKPNSDQIFALLQQSKILFEATDFTEKGFVFSSFDTCKTVLIPENESEILNTSSVKVVEFESSNDIKKVTDTTAKAQFELMVQSGITAIKKGDFKKVVLSRVEEIALDGFDFVETFKNLLNLYPSAFVYSFYHPEVGFWMGASPEQLLKSKNNIFETTSLAGTQKDKGDVSAITWQQKEKDEQQYVTDYILKKLKNVASKIDVSEPYSLKAGSIWHIKTDISGELHNDSNLKQVIDLLHPTPAVCGLPKKKAMTFIVENENYNRSFYTGFLGELNSNRNSNESISDLFVNLRCMQIINDKVNLYMGCGITAESVPEKEWKESVNKSMIMKKALCYLFKEVK